MDMQQQSWELGRKNFEMKDIRVYTTNICKKNFIKRAIPPL